jgi:hypothetical protein
VRLAQLTTLAVLAMAFEAAPVASQENLADRAFVTKFVDAVNRGAAARLPLVHGNARACATAPSASGGT